MSSPTFPLTSGGSGGTGTNDHTQLTNRTSANQHPAASITPVTTNFDGNLSSDDDTVQKALETLDAMETGGTTLPVEDTTAIVKDPSDATKLVRIDAGTVGTGQTRVITMPNQDVDLTPGTGTFPAASHAHGNVTSAGLIGTTATLPIITGTGGILQAGAFGTDEGTFCQGNDSRLSDARAPNIAGLTAETSIADDDLVAIYDTSASANRKMTKANFVAGLGGLTSTIIQRSIEGVVYETSLMYWVAPANCNIASAIMALSSNPSASSTYCKVQVMKNGILETNSIFTSDAPMQITEVTSATNGIYQAAGTLDSGQTSFATGDVLHFRVNQADTGSADLLVQVKVNFT